MCGIAGIIQKEKIPRPLINQIELRLQNRGPDQTSHSLFEYQQWNLCLISSRLEITGGTHGAQPRSERSGRFHLVYNGEIYNHEELVSESELNSHSDSDTDFLVHFLPKKQWHQLNGMYAFGLWDSQDLCLELGRDPIGIKPLFYSPLPCGGLMFSSDLRTFMLRPDTAPSLNQKAVEHYLSWDYTPRSQSILQGVFKLSPGTRLTWKGGHISQSSFSKPQSSQAPSYTKIADSVNELELTLNKAILQQTQCRSKMGVFLSGGIDSSLVASLMAQKKNPFFTFSIGFEEDTFNELSWSRFVAKQIQSDHLDLVLTGDMVFDRLEDLLGCLDEPLSDPSYVATFFLSEFASQHTKVVLTGDGADELFGGYPTYYAHSLYKYIKLLPIKNTLKNWSSQRPEQQKYQSFLWKIKNLLNGLNLDMQTRHIQWMSRLSPQEQSQLLISSSSEFDNASSRITNLQEAMDFDFQTYLPGSILAKTDKASMAHGLEARPFYLDKDIVNFSNQLPLQHKLYRGNGKHILKKLAVKNLPSKIVLRPKHGFAIPLSQWLRGPLREPLEAMLHNSSLWESLPFVNKQLVFQWAKKHLANKTDYSRPLWSFLVLDSWLQRQGFYR